MVNIEDFDVYADTLDFDDRCDGSLPLETMLKPDPLQRKLLEDIDRSKARVWALTNAYVTVSSIKRYCVKMDYMSEYSSMPVGYYKSLI